MANSLKGEKALKLADGRDLTIVFDMDALIEAEGLYGKPMHQVIADAQLGFVGAIRAMMFGATRAHHGEMTPRAVADLIATDGDAIAVALTAAHGMAMPAAGAGAEGNAAKPPPRRGRRSGGSGAKQG